MAQKKYLNLDGLTTYDEQIKAYIDSGDAATSTKLTSGTIVVKEAEHSEAADEAGHATSANTATTAESATKAAQDGDGKVISSTYETKTDASEKLAEAKSYADSAAATVKNDLLNGAGGAYDTLKELGDLIDDNADAIDVLESVASGKADAVHTHTVVDITDLTVSTEEINYLDGVTSNVQAQLDGAMAAVDDAKTNVLINNTTDFELNSFGLKCEQDYEYIWTENVDIPFDFYNNSNSRFVSFENEIYLFLNANSVYKFDGNSWSLVMNVPDYLSFSAVVVYNNEVHLIGSSLSSYHTIHYKINFNTKEYIEVSTLPYSFDEGCVVVYNNEIHILGGYDPDNYTSYAYHYKWDGSTWTKLNDLPYGFRNGSAVVYNDEIHIFGGNTDAHYKYHYKYNGTTWTRLNDLPNDFTQDSAIIYDDEIHILGCYYSSGYIPYFYKFDSHNSNWIDVGELPYEFYNGGAVVCNDNIYIIGGGDAYNRTDSKNFFSCSKSSYLDLSSGEIVSLNIGNNQTVSLKAPIDDAITTETTTYSSSKIEELLDDIDVIDDAITTETTTYSSSKIEELLDEKINIDTILDVERGGTGYSTIADTTYSTARYRASSLHSSETTPTTNGVIAWTYE